MLVFMLVKGSGPKLLPPAFLAVTRKRAGAAMNSPLPVALKPLAA
jgi:hypothetical protein